MCVVEVKGARALVASCCAEATNGMVVETESQAVNEARRTILELILANHPPDCLTCDKMATAACRTMPTGMMCAAQL